MTKTAITLDIAGMTCAACAQRIERLLGREAGFAAVSVDLAGDRAMITPGAGLRADEAEQRAVAMVEAAGYRAYPRGGSLAERRAARALRETEARAAARRLWLRTVLALVLFVPFAVAMVLETMRGDGHHVIDPLWQALLATPVQFLCAWPFYQQAWRAVRGGTATMDVLVVLGTSAAYALSLYHLPAALQAHGVPLYFEGSVAVIAFVLLGKLVEQRAKREAGVALGALASLLPDQVEAQEGGGWVLLARQALRPGMVVRVRPGSMVPVDGEIIEGLASFDESSLTGESFPVQRGVGEQVQAGALASGGAVLLRITAVEDETRIARLARLIEDAGSGQGARLPMIDQLTRIFVPGVLIIAAVSLAFWLWQGAGLERALIIAVSVLVVACPCALGLATPIALLAGRKAGAGLGLIVVDQGAFAPGARLDAVAFDKTGTLTTGRPRLLALQPADAEADDSRRQEALRLAAAMASRSDHPLDKAIADGAREAGMALPAVAQWQAEIGGGLTGLIDGSAVRLGSQAFSERDGARFEPLLAALSPEQRLHPAAFLSADGAALAILVAGDPVRPESAAAVAALGGLGLKTIILSGDRQAVVDSVARGLGTDQAIGGLKPEDKLAWLQARQAEGATMAFVGDGLNDGPALNSVPVGFAMGSGTDVAKGAATVILARPDPRLVPQFVALARRVRHGMAENLFLAFVFNAVAIPLAVMGWLSPAIAGAAMALSSISVALNALRLMRWRPALQP